MICFKRTDGFAHDLRYEEPDYILRVGDFKHADGFGELPDIEILHTPEALAARERKDELAAKRIAAMRALEEQRLAAAMVDPLAPHEVKDYAAAKQAAERAM